MTKLIATKFLPLYEMSVSNLIQDQFDAETREQYQKLDTESMVPVSFSRGDNLRTTCLQFIIKKFKAEQFKQTSTFMKFKVYQKHIDLMQKQVTGQQFGSNFKKLLSIGNKPDPSFYKYLKDTWNDGGSRLEFTYYFNEDQEYQSIIDVNNPDNNEKWIRGCND